MTYISYDCAKKIKNFLKESAPEPIDGKCWAEKYKNPTKRIVYIYTRVVGTPVIPAYQLHDLLTDRFCMAMDLKIKGKTARDIANALFVAYWDGGMPLVEKALAQMMGPSGKGVK